MPSVRQQIAIEASSRAVWGALTTEEGVKRWWADDVRLDAREGGRIVVSTPTEDGGVSQERGLFHQLAPTRAIEITWDGGTWKGSRLQLQVGRGEGETKLHVVHSLPDDPERDPAFDAALERWWKRALEKLRTSLEQG